MLMSGFEFVGGFVDCTIPTVSESTGVPRKRNSGQVGSGCTKVCGGRGQETDLWKSEWL